MPPRFRPPSCASRSRSETTAPPAGRQPMEQAKIREALERASDALAKNPAMARGTAAPLTARLIDGLSYEVKGTAGETLRTDMPRMVGGDGGAPNPGWLMRASLAACAASVIAMRAGPLGGGVAGA